MTDTKYAWETCSHRDECVNGGKYGKGCHEDPLQSANGGKPWHECSCGIDADGGVPNDTKITLDDLEKWFGQKMPLPVAKLLWEAPAHFTAGDIRWATRLMRDLLADMARQRDDEARAEGFAAGLEAAAKVAGSLLVRARFGTGEIATEVVYSDFVAAAINALAEGAKP